MEQNNEHEENSYQITFDTWNEIAFLYQEHFMQFSLYNKSYDDFCALLKPQQNSILELGCGPGNITSYLLQKRPDLQLVGIDIAPNMIQLAQANNPNATFHVLDIRHLKTVEQSFDSIIAGFCFPYLSPKDLIKVFQDCAEILPEEAYFYFSFVPGNPNLSGFIEGSSGHKSYFYFYEISFFEELIKQNHFAVCKKYLFEYSGKNNQIEQHCVYIIQKKS